MKKFLLTAAMLLMVGAASAQCNGLIFKITDGSLKKYDNNGHYRGSITSGVMDSDCNSQYIIVVKFNGRVEKYDFDGHYRGSITEGATRARCAGDMIIITKQNGRMEKYDFDGHYRGSI